MSKVFFSWNEFEGISNLNQIDRYMLKVNYNFDYKKIIKEIYVDDTGISLNFSKKSNNEHIFMISKLLYEYFIDFIKLKTFINNRILIKKE